MEDLLISFFSPSSLSGFSFQLPLSQQETRESRTSSFFITPSSVFILEFFSLALLCFSVEHTILLSKICTDKCQQKQSDQTDNTGLDS